MKKKEGGPNPIQQICEPSAGPLLFSEQRMGNAKAKVAAPHQAPRRVLTSEETERAKKWYAELSAEPESASVLHDMARSLASEAAFLELCRFVLGLTSDSDASRLPLLTTARDIAPADMGGKEDVEETPIVDGLHAPAAACDAFLLAVLRLAADNDVTVSSDWIHEAREALYPAAQSSASDDAAYWSAKEADAWLSGVDATLLSHLRSHVSHRVAPSPDGKGLAAAKRAVIPVPTTVEDSPCLLNAPSRALVNLAVRESLRCGTWTCLFDSAVHGSGFHSFADRAIDFPRASALVVRTTAGAVFALVNPSPWKTSNKFAATHDTVLVVCEPHVSIHRPTGYNNNFIYFNGRQKTADVPYGIGAGGKLEYFWLWIEPDLASGKFNPSCTTFHNAGAPAAIEQIGASFEIDAVQLWGMGDDSALAAQANERTRTENLKKRERNLGYEGGAMASDDKAILDMAGITGHAARAGITDHDPDETDD